MNKCIVALGLFFFPLLALADLSSLSFTPPPTDYSVIFLSNMFGIVDGVLHGTGSQIMGAIFTVFNAAVLALGGIVIMYTLIVGTMNTAHEGEMLGKKWSSIWIPVRSTMGLALLIPKASGYCLMQIFVMWVVVQGVGAADRVWGAALDYLNRGGVIIQANMAPMASMTADDSSVAKGAAAMLAGEVCMLGLQKQLEALRTSFIALGDSGPCPTNTSTSTRPSPQQIFCSTPVPDFLATFDAVATQSAQDQSANLNPVSNDPQAYCNAPAPTPQNYTVYMPNFKSGIYSFLNGICGHIRWNSVQPIRAPCPPPSSSVRSALTPKPKPKPNFGGIRHGAYRAMSARIAPDFIMPTYISDAAYVDDVAYVADVAYTVDAFDAVDVTNTFDVMETSVRKNFGNGARAIKVKIKIGKSLGNIGSSISSGGSGIVNSISGGGGGGGGIPGVGSIPGIGSIPGLGGGGLPDFPSLDEIEKIVTSAVSDGIKMGMDALSKAAAEAEKALAQAEAAAQAGIDAGNQAFSQANIDQNTQNLQDMLNAGADFGPVQPVAPPSDQVTGLPSTDDIANASADTQLINMSRATAIQQMYMDYSMVAQTIVDNVPDLTSAVSTTTKAAYPDLALYAFGVPMDANGNPCITTSTSCNRWGQDNANSAILLTGTEFQNGIADYNAIMAPALNLQKQAAGASNLTKSRKFIQDTKAQGWLSAGSYFFDLLLLNGSSVTSRNNTDINTGLEQSDATPLKLMDAFSTVANGGCNVDSRYTTLCKFVGDEYRQKIERLVDLIAGSSTEAPVVPISATTQAVSGAAASTVNGFITNSQIMQSGDQPGLQGPKFKMPPFPTLSKSAPISLPDITFPKGRIPFIQFDLGRMLGKTFYDGLIKPMFNWLTGTFSSWMDLAIQACVYIPLSMMSDLFISTSKLITAPGGNPILALANMGISYINMSVHIWTQIMVLDIATFGIATFIIGLAMPLVLAWMGIMVGIGFATAYFVPFLPYMIFTFGIIGWLMAVVEAMVAAPIVALGITHPEGEGVMGSKGEQALMILMNVFLRPTLMIIGFISAIALTFVAVWIINTGFSHVISYMQDTSVYTGWAGMYAFFFAMLIYVTMYLSVVEKSFNLIYILPDKVLRWIGGHPESVGQEAAGWAEESKKKIGEAGDKTSAAGVEASKKVTASLSSLGKSDKSSEGSQATSTGSNSKPPAKPPAGAGGPSV